MLYYFHIFFKAVVIIPMVYIFVIFVLCSLLVLKKIKEKHTMKSKERKMSAVFRQEKKVRDVGGEFEGEKVELVVRKRAHPL